ncbi:MAG: hypothetical protein ABIZ49_01475 [Opitutaceae bacterium]
MSVAPIASAASMTLDPAVRSRGPVPFSATAMRNASPAEQRTAVAAQFEAILVRQLLGKTMTSMLGSEGGVAGSVYGDMLSDTISQQLASGQGMGLGRYLEKQFTPRGEVVPSPTPSADTSHP